MTTGQRLRRLNWGCGTEPTPGWINSDIKEDPTVDISCDILDGLPLEEGSIDYAVSIHALPELRYPDQVPALMELRRVLVPGGVLRLALPDLDRAIDAYRAGDRDYFLVPDSDAEALGSKLIVQLLWYGYSKTLFNFDLIAELLQRAGFDEVRRCEFGQTHSSYPEIASLDNRPRESLFVEAVK
ncbi:MAG TPA: methyltransferase domain-containing protein [Solirubrobacterales bacterium]|nr:methyltransferase domain-containing protein [Solirubrobacterales bacterium]